MWLLFIFIQKGSQSMILELLFLLISLKLGLSELTVDYTPPNRVVCKF